MIVLHLATVCASAVCFAVTNRHLPRALRPTAVLSTYHDWKWRNIATSLLHSVLSGVCALLLSLDYFVENWSSGLERISQSSVSRPLLCMSIGYFLYDSVLSLSRVGTYSGRLEIIGHHVITLVTLGSALVDHPLSHTLMPFCVVGLVVELNNVFVHVRSLLELTQLHHHRTCNTLYRVNSGLVLGSILVFRFVPLLCIHTNLLRLLHSAPLAWRMIAHFPVVAIVIISCVIFWRILKDDFLSTQRSAKKL